MAHDPLGSKSALAYCLVSLELAAILRTPRRNQKDLSRGGMKNRLRIGAQSGCNSPIKSGILTAFEGDGRVLN